MIQARRGNHYENAFEHWLGVVGVPYRAVADHRRLGRDRFEVKVFDYLLYPPDSRPQLIEVKGRKLFLNRSASHRRAWDCWITAADLTGLSRWQSAFGDDFAAGFLFAYWLADADPQKPLPAECHWYAGRCYLFYGLDLADYSELRRTRSARWKTLDLAPQDFQRHAWSARARLSPLGRNE